MVTSSEKVPVEVLWPPNDDAQVSQASAALGEESAARQRDGRTERPSASNEPEPTPTVSEIESAEGAHFGRLAEARPGPAEPYGPTRTTLRRTVAAVMVGVLGVGAVVAATVVRERQADSARTAGGTTQAQAAGGRSDDAVSPAAAYETQTTAVGRVDPAVEQAFALFRTRTATPVPANLIEQFASPTRYGRNAALARQIPTATGTGWVIPGDGYLCIAVPDPVDGYGTSCNRTEDVLQRGLYISMSKERFPAGKKAQTLLVPDGRSAKLVPDSGELLPALSRKKGAAVESPATGVISSVVDAEKTLVVEPQ